jgi:hypothetical protein
MVAVNIDDLWARGIIKYINHVSRDDIKYVCWLPDYGVMRQVSWVFYLPEEIEKCPPVAKQASLYNVVNLMTDLVLGENGYEFKLKKTTSEIEGVRKVAVDCIETAEKIFFSITNQDQFNTYGDIICLNQDNHKQSLTDLLIEKNLIISDQEMFKSLDISRAHFKEKYINHSPNWEQQLDRTETENLDKIIFNKKENKNFEIVRILHGAKKVISFLKLF